MSSLNSSLNMGQRALSINQRAMQTVGHNIANQETEGFSRQQVRSGTSAPDPTGLGGGADAQPTSRVYDKFVQRKILQENPRSEMFKSRGEFLQKIEIIFSETEGNGLHKALNEFWNSWSQLSNQPESEPARMRVKEQSDVLASRFRGMHSQLSGLRKEINGRLVATVNKVNELGQKVAELNRQIFSYEGRQRVANDMRDARNQAIEELSALVDVNSFEDPNGRTTVIIGRDWTLVEGINRYQLDGKMKGGELGMLNIDGVSTNDNRRDLTRTFREGEMAEMLRMRDDTIVEYQKNLDEIAFSLAGKVNKIHASGTGINSATEMMKSTFGLNSAALNQPLPFLKDGIFQLHLVDPHNEILETYEIEVQAGKDTLPDIVRRLNQTVNDPGLLQASIEGDGSLLLQSGTDYKFIFGEDQSSLAQVLGLNSFFDTLKGAEDIQLSGHILENTNNISTGKDLIPGDNRIALEIAKLQTRPTMRDETMTFDEYYNGVLTGMGLKIQRNNTEQAQQESMVKQFKEIRSSISSVNMDEELADMMQYQKAYEASARFINTIDK
ncbi:MAG: flagellar hook-associated protein FlgK, partial [SAR324 cluster bacterium]|nr:flagellar hook-associated protein FlgK [SAR324 cluster bacterium]